MKIEVTNGKKHLVMRTRSNKIGIEAPANGDPFIMEFEMQEGSPFKVIVDGTRPIPIASARLVHSRTYYVKPFKRKTQDGVVAVPGHVRRMPIRWKREKGI